MRISVNEANTIKNFSAVLTDKTKVLSELIQNARRAGATRIDLTVNETSSDSVDIVVVDNGAGISDFNTLFTLSQSGWDESVSAESAFGMGFFACFFAAEFVTIESKGYRMTVESAVARSMSDFGEPAHDPIAAIDGTRITLTNVKMREHEAVNTIRRLAVYSRVEISLNGDVLEREMSLKALSEKGLEVVDAPFGQLVLRSDFNSNLNIILQDMRIYGCYGYDSDRNYLFSDTLMARMPDRDKLLNEDDTVASIKKWLAGYYADKLSAIRERMADDEAFLDKHFSHVYTYCPEILNQIAYLPAEAFWPVSYPILRDDYDTPQCLDPIAARPGDAVVISNCELALDDNPIGANFLYFANAQVLKNTLASSHWVNTMAKDFRTESEFEVVCENVTTFPFHLDYVGNGDALVAKSVTIKHSSGLLATVDNNGFASCPDVYGYGDERSAVVIADGVPLDGCPTVIIQSAGSNPTGQELLLQVCSYTSENEEWRDNELELDSDSFERQFIAATGGNIESIMKDLLGSLPPVIASRLEGKTLSMSVTEGKVAFQLVA